MRWLFHSLLFGTLIDMDEVGLRTMRANKRLIHFAICLAAKPGDDLEVGKVYRVLPDMQAAEVGCLRVLDESGEDYLYAAKRFVLVDIPQEARGRVLKAVKGGPPVSTR